MTIEKHRKYIAAVAERVIRGDLSRIAGVYKIDTIIELSPELREYGQSTISYIYETVSIEQEAWA